MGHRQILFISNPIIYQSRDHKYCGYCKALTDHGIVPDSQLICQLPYYDLHISSDSVPDDILLKASQATAMLVSRDEDAIPIMKIFDTNHIRIPNQIAVISIDNIPFAESAVISLSSVGYNYQNISYTAVNRLIAILDNKISSNDFLNSPVAPTLYIRDSCGYRSH